MSFTPEQGFQHDFVADLRAQADEHARERRGGNTAALLRHAATRIEQLTLRLSEVQRDAQRYAWLKFHYRGADFAPQDGGDTLLTFDGPPVVWKDLDRTIDAVLEPK